MKRTPLFISFVLFIALCASAAYWVLQVIQPKTRPMIAPPDATQSAPPLSAAAVLLGGHATASAAGDYLLSGIIMAARPADRIAILASQGQAAHPYRLHAQISSAIKLAEIHENYVVLDHHGVIKRIDLTPMQKLQVTTATPLPTASMGLEQYVPLAQPSVVPNQGVGTISASPISSTPQQIGQ